MTATSTYNPLLALSKRETIGTSNIRFWILIGICSVLSPLHIFDLRNFPCPEQDDVLAVRLEHNPIIAVLTVLRNQCQSMPPLIVSVFVRSHFNSRIERLNSSFGITELCTALGGDLFIPNIHSRDAIVYD